jgi:signal transduction histidine kinase
MKYWDVTDRKLLEREILEISNREQMRIGQDLHDGLGQHLTGITFLARALENKLAARALPEASEAAEICQLVLQALTQTRNLARGLFPVELESAGLVAGLNDLAATVSKLFNITCRVELADPVEVTERNLAHHVFRIAQEAINNAVRHGKAQEIVIRLTQMDDVTLLSIVDNGTGFDPDVNPQHGLGLRIMNYRAQKIGAQLTITSAHPKGTLVTCTFPNQAG